MISKTSGNVLNFSNHKYFTSLKELSYIWSILNDLGRNNPSIREKPDIR